MKKILLTLFVAAACIAPAAAQKKAPAPKPKGAVATEKPAFVSLPIGSPIPNEGAMMQGKEGQVVSLMQAKTEKGLLVMFSCNTCPYVIKSQKRTREAMAMAEKFGIGMVIVNSNEAQREKEDSKEAMVMYSDDQHYTVPYLRDDMSMMANAFGATRTPEVFLFDGSGLLVYKGAMEDNPAQPEQSQQFYLSSALKALNEKKTISVKETKSIGCSIKRMN